MDALDAAEKRNDELVTSERYIATTAYGVQATYPPPKSRGENGKSNTFHSSYLSAGSILYGWQA